MVNKGFDNENTPIKKVKMKIDFKNICIMILSLNCFLCFMIIMPKFFENRMYLQGQRCWKKIITKRFGPILSLLYYSNKNDSKNCCLPIGVVFRTRFYRYRP